MKVGFTRFTGENELDMYAPAIGNFGIEFRAGIFYAFQKQNIDFVFLSEFTKHTKTMVSCKPLFTDDSYNFPFYGVEYDPVGYPDIDTLFIECGHTNTTFDNGKIINRTAQLIKHHTGHVLYLEHGVQLPFPFGDFNQEYRKEVSKFNMGNIFANIDPFLDKQWTHLSNIHPDKIELLQERTNSPRNRYKDFADKIEWKTIPVSYTPLEPFFSPKEKPKYDIMYVGNTKDKNRKLKIKKFIDIKNSVVISRHPGIEEVTDHIKYLGSSKVFAQCYEHYNDSYLSVVIGNKLFEEVGMVQHRPIDIIRGGAVALVDADIYGCDRYFDDEFIVHDQTDVERWLAYLKDADIDERKKIQTSQLSKFNKWEDYDWKKIV